MRDAWILHKALMSDNHARRLIFESLYAKWFLGIAIGNKGSTWRVFS